MTPSITMDRVRIFDLDFRIAAIQQHTPNPSVIIVFSPPVTMMNRSFLTLLLVGLLSSFTGAFAPKSFSRPELRLQALPQQITSVNAKIAAALTVAAINLAPLAALAEDDYEYGAVDAPIGIAVGGGVLAILTALLPVVMKGGEEAFEEIKDQSADSFGKKDNANVLNQKKK
jgi:hypothetical protein